MAEPELTAMLTGRMPEHGDAIAYASWGQRFLAWLIDVVIVWVPINGVVVALIAIDPGAGHGEGAAFVFLFAAYFLAPLYWAFAHSREGGQTLGKRIVGIRVRNRDTNGRLRVGQAVGRAYLMLGFFGFLAIPFLVDALSPLWDEERRSLHDKAAGSIVVRA